MNTLLELLLPRLTSDPFVRFEAGLTVAAMLAAILAPAWWRRRFAGFDRLIAPLAARPRVMIVSAGLSVLVLRAALAPVIPPHHPAIHDEFGYLLQGETFASGRMANPAHPLWVHFESFHIIQQPTYASMHPVAQGLWLALGRALSGDPSIGVFLSSATMCAALCWMLLGWLPARWALAGTAIAVIRLGPFNHWMNSYWGGAAAAAGGALVLGAIPRLIRRPRARDAALASLGLAILANSRPYEGLLLALAAGLALLLRVRRSLLRWRMMLPAAAILALTAVAMMTYFRRVTGDPFRLPYLVNRQSYAIAPLFLWQSPRPAPQLRHEVMRKFYLEWEPQFQYAAEQRTVVGYLAAAGVKLRSWLAFYAGPALMVPLVLTPWVLRRRRIRPLVWVAAISLAGSALQVYFQPHYVAPLAGLYLVFWMTALRWVSVRKPTGYALARLVPAVCVAMLIVRAAAGPLALEGGPDWPLTWSRNSPSNPARARILDELAGSRRRHIVLVRYGPDHDPLLNEWVYNEPDIDRAPVVWAREMDAAHNRKLLDYFHDRTAWLAEPDRPPVTLVPYPR